MLASACDAGFALFCWGCLLRWILVAFPMMRAASVVVMLIMAAATTLPPPKYNTVITKALPEIPTRHENKKTSLHTRIVAQTLQYGALGASFGHPYRKKIAFGGTLGPPNRQSLSLRTILSAQGPQNEIFGFLFGDQKALWDPFGGPKVSTWSLFGPLWRYTWPHGSRKKHP